MGYKDETSLQEVWKQHVFSEEGIAGTAPPRIWALDQGISSFLDAGCGRGTYVAYAAEQGIYAVGIDIVPEAMRMAQKTGMGHFVLGDVRALPFEDNYFDYIISYGVVEHFDETDLAVREMFRVLKPGGTAVISVPGIITLHWLSKIFGMAAGTWGCGYEKGFTPWGFRKVLEKENFSIEDMRITETGIWDFPNHPKLAGFVAAIDRGLGRARLGGRFIFTKCTKKA
jgi:SAM-dependent methyltransferase